MHPRIAAAMRPELDSSRRIPLRPLVCKTIWIQPRNSELYLLTSDARRFVCQRNNRELFGRNSAANQTFLRPFGIDHNAVGKVAFLPPRNPVLRRCGLPVAGQLR